MLDATRYAAPEALDLTRFFDGRTDAWGLFQDRFGTLRRRFTVKIEGGWDGDSFAMDEAFQFDDGAVDHRVWRIHPGEDGRFTASTDDVVGTAAGHRDGPVISLRYLFKLRAAGRTIVTRFDDRMFLIDNDILLNRAVVTKWGIRIGALTIVFKRLDGPMRPRSAA